MKTLVMPLPLVLLVAAALGSAGNIQGAQESESFTDFGNPPTGRLGHPIGSYLTIEGRRHDKGMNPNSYVIDTVNGVKLEKPVLVLVENLKSPLPEPSAHCVINGYETFRWWGRPEEVRVAEGWERAQHPFQPGFFFRATSVRQPVGLQVAVKGR